MKRWSISSADEEKIKSLQKATGLSEFICKLLAVRGIETFEQAKAFIDESELSDPFLLEDMNIAVQAIRQALENGTKITVFGDYDCDGVTATVILYSYLEAVGGEVNWYIPSREEGYGMNIPALENLIKQGTQMVITVDNGISAVNEAEFLKQNNIPLIITDHHKPPEVLPDAVAIINPHRIDDNSPFKPLAGAGVALKLVAALEDGDCETVLEQYSEIATIGTIGDIVPLEGENRTIVSRGLNGLLNTENLGLIQLMKNAGLTSDRINSTSIAFTLCPRINAAGRYEHAARAVELFLCENNELAKSKAELLSQLNTKRREAEADIISEIEKQISENPSLLDQRVLIISGENWHHGVIGIVSARILEKYGKPNMIISFNGVEGRASARSIDGFSLYKLLTYCSDLLEKFGGHTKAAGFSIEKGNLETFKQRVYEYCAINHSNMPVHTINADFEISAKDLTEKNLDDVSLLEPFGENNPEPVFLFKNCIIKSTRALKNGKYTSFEIDFEGKSYKALCFSTAFADFIYNINDNVDIIGVPQLNEYQGKISIIIKVKDMRYCGFKQERYFNAISTYQKLRLGENVDKKLLNRIIPNRDDMKTVFDIIKNNSNLEKAEIIALSQRINTCMFRVAVDSFEELGIIKLDKLSNNIKINKGVKAKLSESELLKKLASQLQ